MYSTGENCIFILNLFNKGTADKYDMFTSGCNSIVRLNRRLNRRLTEYGAYFTLVHNNQPLTCRNAGVSGVNIFSIYPDIWQIMIYLYGSILIYLYGSILIYLYGSILIYLYGSILIYLYGSILIYGSIRPDTYICHCYE